jgi:hypothetical protein
VWEAPNVSLEAADTTTAAFIGSDRDALTEAAREFFAASGERLYLVRCDSGPEFARLDGLDVSLVASPGAGIDVIEAGARYCERRGDCIFVADAAPRIAERVTSSYAALLPPPSAAAAGELASAPVWEGEGQTLSPDPEWKYVSVRRTAIFIEQSIDKGTRWAVFEPNEEPLWASLRRCISEFLEAQWRLGAFQGGTADEAYFVTCDRTTMTQDDIDSGRVIVVVGFAPIEPAEFVVLRIGLASRR